MENYLASQVGQGRAPNTIKLRNEYTQYSIEAQSRGESVLPFEPWAKANYPDYPILSQ